MAKQFTLGKEERLKSRKRIEQLFSDGKSFTVTPYRVFYMYSQFANPRLQPLQFGAGVSTKNFKKAVDRNKIKRLTREAYRLRKTSLAELLKEKKVSLDVFLIFTGREIPGYKTVSEKVLVILNRLQKLVNENSA